MNIFGNKKYSVLASILSVAIAGFSLWIFFGDNFLAFLKVAFWMVFAILFAVLYLALACVPSACVPIWVEKAVLDEGFVLSKISKFLVGVAVAFVAALISFFGFAPLLYKAITFFGGSAESIQSFFREGHVPGATITLALFFISLIVSVDKLNSRKVF